MAVGLSSFLNDLVLVTQRVVEIDKPMTPGEMLTHLRYYVENRGKDVEYISLDVTPTTETQTFYPEVGKVYSKITVNPIPLDTWMEIPTEEKVIDKNGKYNVKDFASVDINVNTLFSVDESGTLSVKNGNLSVDESGVMYTR